MFKLTKIVTTFVFLVLAQVTYAEAQSTEYKPQTLEELKAAIEKIRVDTNTPAVGIALVNKDGPYWIAGRLILKSIPKPMKTLCFVLALYQKCLQLYRY
jgi:hypothetical protein